MFELDYKRAMHALRERIRDGFIVPNDDNPSRYVRDVLDAVVHADAIMSPNGDEPLIDIADDEEGWYVSLLVRSPVGRGYISTGCTPSRVLADLGEDLPLHRALTTAEALVAEMNYSIAPTLEKLL